MAIASTATRRGVLAGFAATCAFGSARAAAGDPAAAIAALEHRAGGRLGVFVRDTGSGRALAHRADERFLLASTFKGPLAAMTLARIGTGADSADAPVRFATADLLPASPVTTAAVSAGQLPVATLVRAILERSDNTGANLLLRRAGGPAALTAWLRRIGDPVTRIDRYELVGGWSGLEDTTTPRAIAATAAAISLGPVLDPAGRALNNRWMANNVAGPERLRGGLPPGWTGGDRTGTTGAIRNDYAVVFPPNRAPLVIAAYYERDGGADDGDALLRQVGRIVAGWAA